MTTITYHNFGANPQPVIDALNSLFPEEFQKQLTREFEYVAKHFCDDRRIVSSIAMGGAVLNALDWAYEKCDTHTDLRVILEMQLPELTRVIQGAAKQLPSKD